MTANLSYQWLGPAIFVSAGVAFLLLYWHDHKQLAALRLAGAYFVSLIGFMAVMLVDEASPAGFQLITLASLFFGHFLLVWGVASLFRQKFPRLAFGLALVVTSGAIIYANLASSAFSLRYTAVCGFIILVDLICCRLVWRARSHRVDIVVAAVFLVQAMITLNRIVQINLSEVDLSTRSAFIKSHFASSMQTENAIFAIVIGLALFARYSVTLVMRLSRLAETDPLTGLFNRRAFEAKVPAMRTSAAPLPTGLIICDIDHFKRVNDTYGHDVGDTVLKTVAQLLQNVAGDGAICARLGGEEFCILLPDSNGEMTRLTAARLRVAIEMQQMVSSGRKFGLTGSFGYCELAPGDDLRVAMARADAAVYQAKADGRNLVRSAPAILAVTHPAEASDRVVGQSG
ncbi:MAG: GGDEF domain-containing protein [Hoeflea sp.]|uniref:GGDEF domain-containing protein n=1 Tax=Hoeflea sp. TaxID=1940281 RepID=UPI002730A08A|nr:GGDEF domain-containing protein [Hoeflea sp.]MDP2121539.1 GGDEF domain-containing protein [Hoeflea sp.]MDZ7601903.1 GGDEF domain-containing protein [Hoeflea sp.]